MINVLMVTKATFPEGMAATNKIRCLALASNNKEKVSFRILAPSNHQPTDRFGWNYKGNWKGIQYHLLRNKPKLKGVTFYVWQQLWPFLIVFKAMKQIRKVDLYYLYIDRLIPQLILLITAKLFRKKVAIQVVEYPYATDGDKLTRIRWVNKILVQLTLRAVYPLCDGFDYISNNLKSDLMPFRPKNAIVCQTPILTDISTWDEALQHTIKTPENYIFHAGSLSEKKDGIINFLKTYALVVQQLKKEGKEVIKLIFTNTETQVATKIKINDIIEKHQLQEHIIVTGYLSRREMVHYQNNAKLLYYNKPINKQNNYNFPIKIADYLLSKAPIVLAVTNNEINRFIKNKQAALVVEADNIQQSVTAIIYLLNHPVEAKKIGLNGRKTVLTHFDYCIYTPILHDFYQKIIG